MRRADAVRIVALLEAAWSEMSDTKAQLYVAHLEPYSVEDVEPAVRGLIRHSRFLPSIADLLDEVEARRALEPGPLELDGPPKPPPDELRRMFRWLRSELGKRGVRVPGLRKPPDEAAMRAEVEAKRQRARGLR